MQKGKAPTAAWASVREFRSVDLPEEGLPTIPISGSLGMREGRQVYIFFSFSLVDAVITPCTSFFFFLFGMDSNCCEYLFVPCFLFLFFFAFLEASRSLRKEKKISVTFCFHSQEERKRAMTEKF